MNQTALKKRYGLTAKQLSEALQLHIKELNSDGDHAVSANGHWNLDEIGVSRLDKLLHYVPDLPVQASDTSKNALKAENEELKAQVAELKDCILKAEKNFKEVTDAHAVEKQEYEKQLEELTKQVCDTQEGQKFLNGGLIRKYQNEADKAKTALKYEKEKSKDKIASLTKMVEELQSREEDYNKKLNNFVALRNDCLKLQTEMAISGEEQQKLLKELREKNDYISKLEDIVNVAKETNIDNTAVNTLLIKDVNLAIREFLSSITALQSSVCEHAISDDSGESLSKEIEAVSERQRRLSGQDSSEDKASEDSEAAQAEEINNPVETETETMNEADSDVWESPNASPVANSIEPAETVKGANKLKTDNAPRDTAIDLLRQNQERLREEVREENALKEKGFFARVASWFIA